LNIWIDLSNSPHPLLFAPIARELEKRGHRISVTARDNAQTVAIAQGLWPDLTVIGGPSPKQRRGKAIAIGTRVRELTRWAASTRPDVALSHNSYAQIVAARIRGVTTITAMDYEHQPANHLAFRLAERILMPEAMRVLSLRRQGVTTQKVAYYPGLKEEIYLGNFKPGDTVDSPVRTGTAEEILVIARTPPSRAAYHRFDNPLFEELLVQAAANTRIRLVVLTRHPEQLEGLAALESSRVIVPRDPIDSRAAMYEADLVVGAGGTMTREAALLGVPTLSVFAGREPEVDRWLERRGMLTKLRPTDAIPPFRKRSTQPTPLVHLRARSAELVDWFASAIESHAKRRP
jgi:predicted glycosyltransferase